MDACDACRLYVPAPVSGSWHRQIDIFLRALKQNMLAAVRIKGQAQIRSLPGERTPRADPFDADMLREQAQPYAFADAYGLHAQCAIIACITWSG